MSQPLKTKTLVQAISILNALGAKYGVEYDGVTYGLPLQRETKPETPTRRRIFNHFTKYRLFETLDPLKPGDEITYKCDSCEELKSLQSTIGSRAMRTRGVGGIVTHQDVPNLTLTALVILPLKHAA